jgi:hypothetical protein
MIGTVFVFEEGAPLPNSLSKLERFVNKKTTPGEQVRLRWGGSGPVILLSGSMLVSGRIATLANQVCSYKITYFLRNYKTCFSKSSMI